MFDGKNNMQQHEFIKYKKIHFSLITLFSVWEKLYLRTKPFSAACVLFCITTIATAYALLKHAGTFSTSVNTEPRTKQKRCTLH